MFMYLNLTKPLVLDMELRPVSYSTQNSWWMTPRGAFKCKIYGDIQVWSCNSTTKKNSFV